MKNTLAILAVLLFAAAAAQAKIVKLSDYATPNDGNDDTSGFQSAVTELKSNGGGTLLVGEGTWELRSIITFADYSNYVSYLVQGEKGAILYINGSDTSTIFWGGNTNQIEFKDLIFKGNSSDTYDASYVGHFLYALQVKVTGCQFYGVRAKNALFKTENVDVIYDNNQFAGSCGDTSAIYANESVQAVTVSETTFFDYGNFKDTYYSKVCGASWIKVDGPSTIPGNGNAPRVVIDRARFDEGTATSIGITNVTNVTVENSAFNVSGVTGATGIKFNNVGLGLIQGCSFGYTTNSRPAVTLVTNSSIKAARLRFSNGVYFASIDGSSSAITEQCPQC